MYSKVFSLLECRADIASLEYAGSFGDSLVSMPQPDSISSRVESVLVGSKRITYACTPAALERAILSNGSPWTPPFEMVNPLFARSRPLSKVVDRNYPSEGMVEHRRATDTTCARAAVPKKASLSSSIKRKRGFENATKLTTKNHGSWRGPPSHHGGGLRFRTVGVRIYGRTGVNSPGRHPAGGSAPLRHADTLESLARNTQIGWPSHAYQLDQVKEHINAVGRHTAELQVMRHGVLPWQQQAINEVTSHPAVLAASTEVAISHLRENRNRLFVPEYRAQLAAIASRDENPATGSSSRELAAAT